MGSFILSMGGKVNSAITNVKREKLLEILRGFSKQGSDYNYMILTASDIEPVDGCSYIRVEFKNLFYKVEVKFDFEKYGYKTKNIYEVENILEDFLLRSRAPDVKKWGWEEQSDF